MITDEFVDDECRTGDSNCDPVNGYCINKVGSFKCRCKEGFQGNGVHCASKLTLTVGITFVNDNFVADNCTFSLQKVCDEDMTSLS